MPRGSSWTASKSSVGLRRHVSRFDPFVARTTNAREPRGGRASGVRGKASEGVERAHGTQTETACLAHSLLEFIAGRDVSKGRSASGQSATESVCGRQFCDVLGCHVCEVLALGSSVSCRGRARRWERQRECDGVQSNVLAHPSSPTDAIRHRSLGSSWYPTGEGEGVTTWWWEEKVWRDATCDATDRLPRSHVRSRHVSHVTPLLPGCSLQAQLGFFRAPA